MEEPCFFFTPSRKCKIVYCEEPVKSLFQRGEGFEIQFVSHLNKQASKGEGFEIQFESHLNKQALEGGGAMEMSAAHEFFKVYYANVKPSC